MDGVALTNYLKVGFIALDAYRWLLNKFPRTSGSKLVEVSLLIASDIFHNKRIIRTVEIRSLIKRFRLKHVNEITAYLLNAYTDHLK